MDDSLLSTHLSILSSFSSGHHNRGVSHTQYLFNNIFELDCNHRLFLRIQPSGTVETQTRTEVNESIKDYVSSVTSGQAGKLGVVPAVEAFTREFTLIHHLKLENRRISRSRRISRATCYAELSVTCGQAEKLGVIPTSTVAF